MLHHVNFMVTEVDDIGRGISRFNKAQVPIVNGPGRHPPSGSMFLYYLDPDGMTVEYSFGMEEFPAEGARKPTRDGADQGLDRLLGFLPRSAQGDSRRDRKAGPI